MKPRIARSPLCSCSLRATKLDRIAARQQSNPHPGVWARLLQARLCNRRKVGGSTLPDGRYLQAVAFDETRRVAVMFGGLTTDTSTSNLSASQETWEWSLTTGEWTNRTATGTTPAARSGAAMAFDSQRTRSFSSAAGRAADSNYQDTWEWIRQAGPGRT